MWKLHETDMDVGIYEIYSDRYSTEICVQTHLPSGPETSTWVRIQWRPPGNQINQTCLAGKSTIYSSWMILQVINLHLVWGFSSQKCLTATAEAKPDQQINVNCDQCIDKCVGEGYVRYLKLASTSSSIQQLFYTVVVSMWTACIAPYKK